MQSPIKFGGFRIVVRKVADASNVDLNDLICTIPNDGEATLPRARAEAQQYFERTNVEYVKIFVHIVKAQGGRAERYFCLDPEVDKMLSGHSSQLVETHTREEYLANKKPEVPAQIVGHNVGRNAGRNVRRKRN